MAALPPISDVHQPVRSISLPSRVHPTCVKLEAALNHLKAWKTSSVSTSTAGFSGETIRIGLVDLADLYNCVRETITSPQTQRSLVQYQNGRLVEEALDESVTFLDTCGKARDLLLAMKQHVQTLQSALRRRRGDSSIETQIVAYINFRKTVKKEVAKCLGALKKLERRFVSSSTPLDVDPHLLMVVKVLRETTSITISVFQSLLLFLSVPSMKTRVGGWSKITKLIPLLSSEREHKVINEVGAVDLAFYSINGQLKNGGGMVEVDMLQRTLKAVGATIDGFETGLDCVFRCLVQNRVTFLNIITHQ
ncbi:hypothetical protein Goshw_014583 [Gossypium schwendimanii]|uniref:Uncharacterized protein n=1 Tax=Gossypium schwendimanii TaxID=34291 RepID=A0A7J9LJG4_GOSSC|nr:hypothetical protein [Gossypium schwendimanii]MBA0878883.1 hypothetical protein [Gossypium schwendimanii]